MPQPALDSAKLAAITKDVLWLSLDDRFTPDQRAQLVVIGKKLRGSLLNLITAKFDENTQLLIEANQELDKVNKLIDGKIESLEDATKVVETLTGLVGILDKLLDAVLDFF